jgi:hypothetical protein
MSVLIQGSQQRALLMGVRVQTAAITCPATTSTAIFTVAGRVIVTSLIGEVTTAIQNQSCNFNITFDPTGAGAVGDVCAATQAQADAVGTFYSVTGVQAGLLSAQTAGGTEVPTHVLAPVGSPQGLGFMLPAGSMLWKASATNTGAVVWTITYIPLDDGGSIVAA